MALNAIKARTVMKQDIYRTLIDTTDDASIPRGGSAFKKQRSYSAVVLIFGRVKMFEEAIPLKPYLGTYAYEAMMWKSMLKGEMVNTDFDVEIDGTKWKSSGKDCVSSLMLMITAHNKMVHRPLNFPGVPNDGLMDVATFNID
jgi:hypothetical protein